jgi:putative redox protein
VARARGATGSAAPPYRADLRAGAHELIADEPAAVGGGDLGPTPFGFVMSGLVACTAITVRMYAERKGWDLASIDVDVRYNLADDGHPSIDRTITLAGNLSGDQRERLAEIAERTPVTLALRGGTPITTTFRPAPAA